MPQANGKYSLDDVQQAPPLSGTYSAADLETETPKSAPVPPLHVTPDIASDMFKAGVHSKMLGVTPAVAYDGRDQIEHEFSSRSANYDDGKLDDSIYNDVAVGLEGSVAGLIKRNALPDEVRNPGKIDKILTSLSQLVGDAPFMLAGAGAGGAAGSEVPVVGNVIGAGAGAFAIPAAMREALTQGIKNGKVTSMPDLLRRVASVTWEATKGAVTGAAFEAAGGIPVGSVIGKSAIATTAVKGLYQATALTTTADLLEGHLPTAKDFEGNAALIVPLNLILHGTPLRSGEAKQATMDVYAKDGTTPQETTEKLSAQPPVKPDMPEGLRPAIQVGEGVVEGEATESHDQLAARSLPIKPISMEELEANPDRADNVLQAPEIQDQDVIDRAWQIKKDAIDAEGVPDEDKAKSMEKQVKEQEELAAERKAAGEDPGEPKPPKEPQTIDELYDRAAMKSGRGFTTPDGKFLSRMEARKWVKDNEPDVHEMWLNEQDGDKQAELHSEDYAAARNRVQARNVTEGDPVMDAVPPDIRRTLAEARSGILNKVKAGLASEKYGYEAIRTLLVGPRNFFRAEGEQLASGLRKLIPDAVDQQALHFARDYRGEPDQLRADIEEVRSGDNEKLKAYIPAMERALEPMSPAMAQADQQMTDYFTQQLARGRALGTLDSGIDPSRYSPRMFMRAQEEGSGVGRPTFTDRTVNSIRRDYLHTLDPLKSGDTEARTFNAIDEMSIYNDRMATANSTSIFKTELQNSALGMESSRGKVPADWVPLTKQFEDKVRNEDGSYTVKNLYVPKDIANALKPLLEEPGQLSQLSKFLHVQSVIKGIELTLSAFHVKALNITALNNLGLVDYLRSIHSDNNAPDFQAIERRGAVHGLETTKTGIPFDSYMSLKSSEPATGLARLADNAIVNKADEVAKGISKYIFDNVQRKWKVTDFAKKEAGWIAKHPDATDSEYAAAMRGYAKEVNAAYGGLNWDVMGVSKGTQNVMRMFLLAPDWTFSNVANLKYALTDGGTAGAASRTFFVKSFATGFAMTAAASIFIGGKYDPTDVKHLDQVYLGTDDQGKEMYANWFFAGAPKDAMNLVKRTYSDGPLAGPAEVIISKASPIAGTVIDLGENKDYKGAQIYKRGDSIGSQAEDQGEYAAKKLLPITGVSALEGVTNALRDPNYEYSYKDVLSIAADLVGSPTTHSGAAASNGGGNSAKRFQSARTSGKSRFTIKGR